MTRKITQEELNEILEKHKKWLHDEHGGERADLSGRDLRDSNLRDSDLRGSDLSYSDLSRSDLRDSDLSYSNLRGCNLRDSDLRNSDLSDSDLRGSNLIDCNLRGCNLRGCNLDFSCLPLWCGSLSAHFDDRQIVQVIYHAVKAGLESPNVNDDVKAELRKVIPLANHFHRAGECGVIEE